MELVSSGMVKACHVISFNVRFLTTLMKNTPSPKAMISVQAGNIPDSSGE